MAPTVSEFLLRSVPFLTGLSEEEARALAAAAEQLQYDAGQLIHLQGSPFAGLQVVATGKVAVILGAGRNTVLELGPGDVFGEASLVGPASSSSAYQASGAVLLFSIPSEVFRSILPRNPALEIRARAAAVRAIEPPLEQFAKGFEISRFIAQGGMGAVYEARDKVLGRRVAIKRMRPEVRLDPKGPSMFLQEARITAALRHPNIVEIFSVVEESGEVYLVFEFVEGNTLAEVLEEKGALSASECLRIVRQAAAALGYAHAQRVLHRDFKPSNVMLGSDGVVRIMDFGIARQAKTTLSRMSRADDPCGTLAYMAPEQHLGEEKRQGDIYALGVSLYEMLAGDRPFPGPDYLGQKERMEFVPLSKHGVGAGSKLDALMKRVLASDPGARPSDARAFIGGLEDAFGELRA